MTAESVPPHSTPESAASGRSGGVAAPRRRRGRGVLIALGVLLALVVILIVIAETAGRAWAAGVVRERVVADLGLADADGVDVDLGGGSVVLQAIAGRLDRVEVVAERATFGEFPGALQLEAEGVPISGGATESVDVRFRIPESEAARLATFLTGVPVDDVRFTGPGIDAISSVEVFGLSLPIDLGLTVATEGGALRFTPETLRLGDQSLDIAAIRSSPLGGAADELLAQTAFCVNETLPSGLGLTGAEVGEGELLLEIEGTDVPLGAGSRGSCG